MCRKKIISFILSIMLVVCIISPPSVYAAEFELADENDIETSGGMIRITSENIKDATEQYHIPKEVVQYLEAKLRNTSTNELYVASPDAVARTGSIIRQTAPSTGYVDLGMHNGYRLKEWIVTTKNGFNQEQLGGSAAGRNALSFAETLLFYALGAYLGEVTPFGSAGVTLLEYTWGLETDTVTPTSEDKASAAPKYTTFDYFTYVETPEGDMLGCRSSMSVLETITWYCYSHEKHDQKIKIMTYYKTICSPNNINRKDMAVQNFAGGGFVDVPVTLVIANKHFLLI